MSKSESTSILNRFGGDSENDVYQPDGDYKPYGVSRHAVSLNCIGRDGNQTGISWSLYSDARYNPSTGIEIEFTHKRLAIKGHDLLQLYHYILGNRATFIAEADRATAKILVNSGKSVVTEIVAMDQVDQNKSTDWLT